jgi:hypothetical protein
MDVLEWIECHATELPRGIVAEKASHMTHVPLHET